MLWYFIRSEVNCGYLKLLTKHDTYQNLHNMRFFVHKKKTIKKNPEKQACYNYSGLTSDNNVI